MLYIFPKSLFINTFSKKSTYHHEEWHVKRINKATKIRTPAFFCINLKVLQTMSPNYQKNSKRFNDIPIKDSLFLYHKLFLIYNHCRIAIDKRAIGYISSHHRIGCYPYMITNRNFSKDNSTRIDAHMIADTRFAILTISNSYILIN